MSGSALLELDSISYRWSGRQSLRVSSPSQDQWALAIPEFCLQPAETIFIHGGSGSGKSTFLNILAGILRPQSGSVRVAGENLAACSPRRVDRLRADLMGIIFQQFNLLPYLSVMDNVLLGTYFQSSASYPARGEADQEAKRLLEACQLPAQYWQCLAGELSVGQQQRVAAARAFLGRPKIILADEPTSALDRSLRDAFMQVLLNLSVNHDVAVIMVSHDRQLGDHFSKVIAFDDLNSAAAAA